MVYNLADITDRVKCLKRIDALIQKEGLVELTEVSARTLPQNKYLHLLIRYLANEMGEKEGYVKEYYYKILANAEIFVIESFDTNFGNQVQYIKSSADLTKAELSKSIDNFRMWASMECGIELPAPNEEELVKALIIEASRYGLINDDSDGKED